MLIDWADRTEAVINSWPDQTDDERVEQALSHIADNLAQYPPGSVEVTS
jgi:hypothetical protein